MSELPSRDPSDSALPPGEPVTSDLLRTARPDIGHVADALAYYRDLSPGERVAVDAHLAGCPACRELLAEYRRQDLLLAAIPSIVASVGEPSRIGARPSDPAGAERGGWRRLAGWRGVHWPSGVHRPSGVHGQRDSMGWMPSPAALSSLRRVFAHLGDGMALAGLVVLFWAVIVQREAFIHLNLRTGAVHGPGSTVPAIPIPPAHVAPPSPWLPAMPWLGGALVGVGMLFILSRRSWVATLAGALAASALLVCFVPPFSVLPNPAGLAWRAAGGYSYDPRLPFKNDFLILGRPDAELRPRLDRLVGKVGLSPLDPVQPMVHYEILRVGLHPRHNSVALVTTRFDYADGSSRTYPVPLAHASLDVFGFWLSYWRDDGLGRLFSDHLVVGQIPFASAGTPIRLGAVRRLDLDEAADRLDEANPEHWLWDSVRVQHLVFAPDGRSFLAVTDLDTGVRQLWQVPLGGAPPEAIGAAGDVRAYGWAPDGSVIVYTRRDPDAVAVDSGHPYAIMAVRRTDSTSNGTIARAATGWQAPVSLATALDSDHLPGLTVAGAWFFAHQSLWLAPMDGSPTRLMAADLQPSPHEAPWPAPDGRQVAFACGADRGAGLCLAASDGGHLIGPLPIQAAEAAWSADGSRLAVVDRDPNNLRPVQLAVLSVGGQTVRKVTIAPNDVTEPPQWSPDGGAILVQTYPYRGRRIIAVDLASGKVIDLSRERWDTYFALAPDGRWLLLNNGRGGFWRVELIR